MLTDSHVKRGISKGKEDSEVKKKFNPPTKDTDDVSIVRPKKRNDSKNLKKRKIRPTQTIKTLKY